ncbi:unnamed protein product [Chrysodeixis includens]|uniref:Uncharacterized protein n=1 Tax=Chrysodeixis includens TaxID=689277 RepID=A0A9P0FTD3_CHRIL|nr:unnamed protein product [Chrysodeixis includens]
MRHYRGYFLRNIKCCDRKLVLLSRMLIGSCFLLSIAILNIICAEAIVKKRQRRYLLFTPSTQWGVFATVSVPLPTDSYVSVAWFYEANYYNVANVTYFEPLLGDIETMSRSRQDRSITQEISVMTRRSIYNLIESILKKHGYPGRPCLLRLICENAHAHFLHNGVMGDLIYLILTPSASQAEDDIEDRYYEAEYYGLKEQCECYTKKCPSNPLDPIFLYIDDSK